LDVFFKNIFGGILALGHGIVLGKVKEEARSGGRPAAAIECGPCGGWDRWVTHGARLRPW